MVKKTMCGESRLWCKNQRAKKKREKYSGVHRRFEAQREQRGRHKRPSVYIFRWAIGPSTKHTTTVPPPAVLHNQILLRSAPGAHTAMEEWRTAALCVECGHPLQPRRLQLGTHDGRTRGPTAARK